MSNKVHRNIFIDMEVDKGYLKIIWMDNNKRIEDT